MSFITLIFLCLSFGLASITLWLIIIYQVFKIRPLFALFCIVFPVSVIYFGFRFPVQIKKVVFFLTLSIVGFFSTGLAYQKGWYESIDPFLEERKKLEELTFEIDVGNLPQLRIEETDALFRYMAGSFRWDMKVIDGRYVAIRKKIEQDDSNDSENQRSSTSILVSFSEGPNYYGIDFGQINERVWQYTSSQSQKVISGVYESTKAFSYNR
mgnify:CR=1 FL=1